MEQFVRGSPASWRLEISGKLQAPYRCLRWPSPGPRLRHVTATLCARFGRGTKQRSTSSKSLGKHVIDLSALLSCQGFANGISVGIMEKLRFRTSRRLWRVLRRVMIRVASHHAFTIKRSRAEHGGVTNRFACRTGLIRLSKPSFRFLLHSPAMCNGAGGRESLVLASNAIDHP